jgi:hypothetical protein
MGSFNLKGHSGTLQRDEEAILIFVSQTGIEQKYINGEYQMLSLPLECKYLDRGLFELLENSKEKFEIFHNWLKNHVVDIKEGKNKYHDIPVNAELLNWEFIQEAIREKRLLIKSKTWRNENIISNQKEEVIRNVEVFAVHKIYFDQVINNFKYSEWNEKNMNFNSYLTNLESFYNNYKEVQAEEIRLIQSGIYSFGNELFDKKEELKMKEQKYRILLDNEYTHVFAPVSEILTKSFYKGENISKELLLEIAKSLYFKEFIEKNQFELTPVRYGNEVGNNNYLLKHLKYQLNSIKLGYLNDMDDLYDLLDRNLKNIEERFSQTIDELFEEFSSKTNIELLEDEKLDKIIRFCILD